MNPEKIRQQISEIEELYERANFQEAYEKFKRLCSPFSAHRNEALSILTSYNDLNNRIIIGTLSTEDETRSKQQIGNRFLMCLNRFKEDILPPTETGIKSDDSAQSLPIHLLVRLIPNPDNRNQKGRELFTVEIYSWKGPNDVDCEFRIDNCLLADVPQKLDECIFSEFDENDDIQTIEFILPSELIVLEADQWLMEQTADIETKFGEEYHVLIRLDRDKLHPKLRQKWKKRWEFFNNNCQSHESSVFWICNHQAYEPKHLCKAFSCSDIACCLMMTFLPSDFNGLGQIILHAGIPVAICARKSEIMENEIRQIVSGKNLSDLPKLICDERKKADHENHIGNHLTLIWDNPERVLPKTYLQTP